MDVQASTIAGACEATGARYRTVNLQFAARESNTGNQGGQDDVVTRHVRRSAVRGIDIQHRQVCFQGDVAMRRSHVIDPHVAQCFPEEHAAIRCGFQASGGTLINAEQISCSSNRLSAAASRQRNVAGRLNVGQVVAKEVQNRAGGCCKNHAA